ncbi:MAG: PorT family protein [Chitinophagales bacterium]|nr:PorT family protein [Chitinophagales bacterium]MDW8419435.1 porin family protein [Chitinophagales bacterium]
MKKKLTVLIFLLPALVMAQSGIQNGSIVIDFGKKRSKPDTTAASEVAETEYKMRKTGRPLITEGEEEAPDYRRDGLFRALFIAGINFSQIDGDEQAGYNYPGAHLGIGTLVKFHKNLSVSLELLYSMKGAWKWRNVNTFPQYVYQQQWDYVAIPLMLNVHDKKLVMFSGGLSFNYLVRNKLRYEVYDPNGQIVDSLSSIGYMALSREPRRFDLGGTAAFQFLIKQVLGVGIRFEYSLIGLKPSVNPVRSIRFMYNNSVTLRLMYILKTVRKKR